MSPVLGCDLDGASGGARSDGCGSGKVGVCLPKWGLGYASLVSLDVDRSSTSRCWCVISLPCYFSLSYVFLGQN